MASENAAFLLTRVLHTVLRVISRPMRLLLLLASFGLLVGVRPAAAQVPGGLNLSLQASPTTADVRQTVTLTDNASQLPALGGTLSSLTLLYGGGNAYTATASNGSSQSASQVITSGGNNVQPLLLNLTATPQIAQVGQPVVFSYSATTSNVGARFTNLTISFGDAPGGSLASAATALFQSTTRGTVSHVYATPATYTATFSATDSTGATGQATAMVQVGNASLLLPPTPIQIVNPPIATQIGQPVSFNAATAASQNAGAVIQSYAWNFGDGGTAVGQSVSHVFSSSGPYTIMLTVTDSAGGSGQTSATLQVASNTPPPGPTTGVTYQPGWNLIAVPAGTTFPGSLGTIYTFQAIDAVYQTPPNPVTGIGYWAFFSTPTTASIPLTGPQTTVKALPAGHWIMIGNPGNTPATVMGADIVYAYSAGAGYQSTTMLQPGQGVWVISVNGGTVTVGSR